MALNFRKGQTEVIDIRTFRVGLGWEPNEALSEHEFDLDVSAFMLGNNKKIINDDYLVFFGSEKRVRPDNFRVFELPDAVKYPPYTDEDGKYHDTKQHWREKTRPTDPEFSVIGSIDDMDGKTSDGGDDETLDIDLSKVRADVVEIIIVVSIHEYDVRRQNFGQIDDAYIRIYKPATPNNDEYKFALNEDYSNCASVEFCRIYREFGGWKLQALGFGHPIGLEELAYKLYVNK